MRSVLRAARGRLDAAPGADPGVWRSVGRSAGAKLLVMGFSGLVSIVSIRLVLGHYGVEAYAQYGLLVSIAALLPFADLGMGAAVLNSVAGSDDPARDDHVRRTLVGVYRVVAVSGSLLVAVGVAVTLAGGWPVLLGAGLQPGSGPSAALACLVLFCLTLPLAVGQRILTALGRNHVRILVQGLASPIFATTVGVLLLTGGRGGGYLAAFSYAGGALIAAVGSVIAFRSLPGLARGVLHDVWRVRSVRGAPVLAVAGPWLVLTLALPVALQTDRLLLSHLSTPTDLAEYGLAFSLFSLLSQTVSAAGVALWPVFARARSTGEVRSPFGTGAAFGAVAALAAVALALLLPWIVPVVSDGAVRLDAWVTWAFVVLVAVQAANYPLGMYMTDAAGLRFQVPPVLLMVPLNLALSWWMTLQVGAGGPVVGSAVAVALCQFAPGVWFVRRDLRRRRAVRAEAAAVA